MPSFDYSHHDEEVADYNRVCTPHVSDDWYLECPIYGNNHEEDKMNYSLIFLAVVAVLNKKESACIHLRKGQCLFVAADFSGQRGGILLLLLIVPNSKMNILIWILPFLYKYHFRTQLHL